MRHDFIKRGLDQGVALPLRGVTAINRAEDRIGTLEPFVTNTSAQILFHTRCRMMLDKLETWPDKQTGHHYELSCCLAILWMISSTGQEGELTDPNRWTCVRHIP
jgi:hypothetical protein